MDNKGKDNPDPEPPPKKIAAQNNYRPITWLPIKITYGTNYRDLLLVDKLMPEGNQNERTTTYILINKTSKRLKWDV